MEAGSSSPRPERIKRKRDSPEERDYKVVLSDSARKNWVLKKVKDTGVSAFWVVVDKRTDREVIWTSSEEFVLSHRTSKFDRHEKTMLICKSDESYYSMVVKATQSIARMVDPQAKTWIFEGNDDMPADDPSEPETRYRVFGGKAVPSYSGKKIELSARFFITRFGRVGVSESAHGHFVQLHASDIVVVGRPPFGPDSAAVEMPPKESETVKCVICMTNDRNVLIRPCGHVVTCDSCPLEETYPMCRREIEKTEKVFIS
jgi:hypothetical protein